MPVYRVFRHGFNQSNNPSSGARPEDCTRHVASVEATDECEALRLAVQEHGVSVYNGQVLWARLENDVKEREAATSAKHTGKILVKYWRGTTTLADWCASIDEIDDCLKLHSNTYVPRFEDAYGNDMNYEEACHVVC